MNRDDASTRIGVIGGSGLTRLRALEIDCQEVVVTPYGDPSAPFTLGRLNGRAVVFLPRHGSGHTIPPHRVNYRANLWALRELGVQRVIGVAAVGGITPPMSPGRLCIPDQVIDYTWGREHTLYNDDLDQVTHIDFTRPYCETLRQVLIEAAGAAGVLLQPGGTYGATQGPRLESAAEIDRMQRDGCDLVGMTGMPETSLAKELGLCYASCAVVVNWAAGRGEGPITMEEIETHLGSGMEQVLRLLGEIPA